MSGGEVVVTPEVILKGQPLPSLRRIHLPAGTVVFPKCSLPWSAWLATTFPLFVLRRTLNARFIFLKDLLLIEDRSKGRAEEKREERNSSYTFIEILLYARLVRDVQ